MVGIIKLVITYFLEKIVFFANQKVGMKVILGLSYQSIQMGQSGFNVEQNQNDLTTGESHLFSTIKLKELSMLFLFVIFLSYTMYMLEYTSGRLFSSLHLSHKLACNFFPLHMFLLTKATLILHLWGEVA
jgi:hypothetical protein